MSKTKIEWADASWNPVTGCTKVSPGCKNCYAERIMGRFQPDRKFTDVRCHEDRLEQPLRWRKTRMVFVNSMSDLFHEDVPDAFIVKVFEVMAKARAHTFQILTKRPQRMRDFMLNEMALSADHHAFVELLYPNVWLGVSAEDQERAEERIPMLLNTPAAVRFASIEPLLGPVSLRTLHYQRVSLIDSLAGRHGMTTALKGKCEKLDWVIVGGESGKHARRMEPQWAEKIRDDCAATETPFFFKQWGEWGEARERIGKTKAGRLLAGVEHNDYPQEGAQA